MRGSILTGYFLAGIAPVDSTKVVVEKVKEEDVDFREDIEERPPSSSYAAARPLLRSLGVSPGSLWKPSAHMRKGQPPRCMLGRRLGPSQLETIRMS